MTVFSRVHRPKTGNCFVIMPFGKKMLGDEEVDWDLHYEKVVCQAIRDVEMTPIRADDIYGSGSLMDDIWKGIQEAEIVITDLTGRSPNVLYELGLAHVIGKRVLLLTRDEKDIPVDLAQFKYIQYSGQGYELVEFIQELKKNITAVREQPADEAWLIPLTASGANCQGLSVT